MTDDETGPDSRDVPPEHSEIDALLDGEAVDRDALRAALESGAARDYLVDALVLRQLVRDMGPARYVSGRTPQRPLLERLRWLAAALILLAGAGAGYIHGQRAPRSVASAASLEVVLDNMPPAAPEPTRHIRFEPGVNWTIDTRSH